MALDSLFLLLKNLVLFSSFVSEKSSFPKPLSKEKETEYVLRAERGDKEAKEILIRHNLRLVAHIAKKYANYGDNDELISVGSIGLIKAVESFRHDKGTQLATYASRCIENEILMTMRTSKKHRSNVSLSEPVGVDRDGNELTIMDMLADTGSVIEDVESNTKSVWGRGNTPSYACVTGLMGRPLSRKGKWRRSSASRALMSPA